jgi:hypothetical protein
LHGEVSQIRNLRSDCVLNFGGLMADDNPNAVRLEGLRRPANVSDQRRTIKFVQNLGTS